MPSVDELLNSAEVTEATLTETNDVIEIDADTRTMIIPDTERIFGVMSDEKGERKYFRCKRFVGNGIDLSKLDLRVIYQNASGLESGRDKYIVTDLATDGEDYVTFSWELSRKVTAYKGIISFIVCAIKTGTDGIITNEWNTTLANGIVFEGNGLGQSLNIIDFNIEDMTSNGWGRKTYAKESKPGSYHGTLTYTTTRDSYKNVPHKFWEDGSGINVLTRDLNDKFSGTTENRPRIPQNNQQYFDTTLNKMLYYINNNWVDAMGEVIN